MKFQSLIPRFLIDSPAFYNVYFHLIRKRKGLTPDYFSSDTDYFFDGYPRSGNTYFLHFLRKLYPDKKAVHHLHQVAPIKIAIKKEIPVFILIRDPKDSISSYYLKYYSMRDKELPHIIDGQQLEKMTKYYNRYYNYVWKSAHLLHIVDFTDLINNTEKVLFKVSEIFGVTHSKDEISELYRLHKNTYRGATTKYGSSKPSDLKESEKRKIKKVLEEIPEFSKCRDVYRSIQSKILAQNN